MPGRLLLPLLLLLSVAPAQDPAAGGALQRFQGPDGTYAIDLPSDWRQMTPAEMRAMRDILPPDMHAAQPLREYSVGPVERWLDDDFDGVSLQVAVRSDEVALDETGRQRIREHWRQLGQQEGVEHDAGPLERVELGPDGHPAFQGLRTSRYAGLERSWRSIDSYVPTGGRTVILSLRAPAGQFDRWEGRFRAMLDSAVFARRPRGTASLGERLGFPIAIGAMVGVALALMYRMKSRRN